MCHHRALKGGAVLILKVLKAPAVPGVPLSCGCFSFRNVKIWRRKQSFSLSLSAGWNL